MSRIQILDKNIDTNFYDGIVITGPTASGKSQLAQYIMRQFNQDLNADLSSKTVSTNEATIIHPYRSINKTISFQETASELYIPSIDIKQSIIETNLKINSKHAVIINSDSVQMYNILHELTAQPDNLTDHYMYSKKTITDNYSAHQWLIDLKKLLHNNKHFYPIIVGGTGFYIRALLNGIQELPERSIHTDWDDLSTQECLNLVKKIDPNTLLNDKRRMIRFLDLHHKGINLKQMQVKRIVGGNFYKIYVSPQTAYLKKRIKARLEQNLDKYILEVKNLSQHSDKMHQIIGYTEISSYLQFLSSKQEITEQIYTRTCQYAKRQHTWFKKYYDADLIIHDVTDII